MTGVFILAAFIYLLPAISTMDFFVGISSIAVVVARTNALCSIDV